MILRDYCLFFVKSRLTKRIFRAISIKGSRLKLNIYFCAMGHRWVIISNMQLNYHTLGASLVSVVSKIASTWSVSRSHIIKIGKNVSLSWSICARTMHVSFKRLLMLALAYLDNLYHAYLQSYFVCYFFSRKTNIFFMCTFIHLS